jgi:hypothetical protein
MTIKVLLVIPRKLSEILLCQTGQESGLGPGSADSGCGSIIQIRPNYADPTGSGYVKLISRHLIVYKRKFLHFYQRRATETLHVTLKTYFLHRYPYLSRDSMRLFRSWLAGR